MIESKLTLRCPACVSSDVVVVDITISGVTRQYYHCNECEFEWIVPDQSTTLATDEP